MRLKKVNEVTPVKDGGKIVDSLKKDSILDAPSIRATKELVRYSTTEDSICGYTGDNKPIYRKIYTINHSGNVSSWTTVGDLPYGYKDTIRLSGIVHEANGNVKPIPHYETTNYYALLLIAKDTLRLMHQAVGYTGGYSTIYLEYTKTTD